MNGRRLIRRCVAAGMVVSALLAPARAALTCQAGAETLDWDSGSVAWPNGSLSQSYTVGADTIGLAFSGATNRLTSLGGNQTPYKSTDLTGGLVPAERNLIFLVDYTTTGESLTLTISAGTTGQGVAEMEFTMFDIDTDDATAPFQFQDRITVSGTFGGSPVAAPTLTPGSSNAVAGNVATGNNASGTTSSAGNVAVRFGSAVDTVTIVYSPGPSSISNPALQGISIHDISFCPANTDYGDAPSAYGSPSHRIVAGIALGSGSPDSEIAAQPTANADGDDAAGSDDENGVTIGSLTQGTTGTVSAAVQGAGGRLQAWFDWNGDGDFADSGEQVATDIQDNGAGDANPATGTIDFSPAVPSTATTSQTYARFRWSTTSGLTAAGIGAANGEVEDYPVTINPSGGPPSCPAGQLLINQSGYAASVMTSSGVVNPSFSLGAIAPAGSSPPDPDAAELDNSSDTLIVDLGVSVPQNGTIVLSAARDNGNQGNTARVLIEVSTDNVTYTALGTYGTATATYTSTAQNVLERNNLLMPVSGVRYVRFTTQNNDDIFIDGLQYSQVCLSSPTLAASKTVAVYNPTGTSPFATPGADVVYSLTVQNSGSGAVDADTLFIVDTLPDEVTFFNGDLDGAGPAPGAVYFTQSGAGLTFNLASDLRYSNSPVRPANFGACAYAPTAGYDPNVKHLCLNPKGSMPSGSPNPSFTVQFRVRIN